MLRALALTLGGDPGFKIRPGARFSKVPITFRARKAICETANRLFWKAGILTCFKGKQKEKLP